MFHGTLLLVHNNKILGGSTVPGKKLDETVGPGKILDDTVEPGKILDDTVEPGKELGDTGALDRGPGVCIDHI